jgi:hypothetical protein
VYRQIRYEVVFFLFGDSPAYEFYWLAFRKTLYVLPVHTIYEDGTGCSETSAHQIKTPGNQPKEII